MLATACFPAKANGDYRINLLKKLVGIFHYNSAMLQPKYRCVACTLHVCSTMTITHADFCAIKCIAFADGAFTF